ncbi:MAG TPA: hypothetical protein VIC24_02850, partial [Gemmatimonadaceae bacterium]
MPPGIRADLRIGLRSEDIPVVRARIQRGALKRARPLLPRPIIVRAYLARSLRLWLGIRVVLALAGALAASNFVRLPAAAIVPVVCLTVC